MILDFLKGRAAELRALITVGATSAILAGCAGSNSNSVPYQSVAYAPAATSNIRVAVSLKTQNVYVMEGDRCLLATPTCVGKPGYLTPTGHFAVELKKQDKRSATYGYWVRGEEAHPGEGSRPPAGGGWTYIGYPMAFWVEFTPGFGFHEGPIWPYPRSHGCLHLHEAASAKFFEIVQLGTPVDIAQTQPEDATFGRSVTRPTDYADPDPAPSLMISPTYFTKPRDTLLLPLPPS